MAIAQRDMVWVETQRRNLGITRDDLRDLLKDEEGIKVSPGTIHNWCRGDTEPKMSALNALVRVIDRLIQQSLRCFTQPAPDLLKLAS
jgi:predicted transcriptional regulator